jgi:chemotaxis protein CheC
MTNPFTPLQLDALREVANTGSGHAAADLAGMFDSAFTLSVPRAMTTTLHGALEALGGAELEVACVAVQVFGDVEAALLGVFERSHAAALCELLGMEADGPLGESILGEVGNLLACAYANVIGEMSGLTLDVSPPELVRDMLGAVVTSVVAAAAADIDRVLVIDTDLGSAESGCSMSVLFVPTGGGITTLLESLGVGD